MKIYFYLIVLLFISCFGPGLNDWRYKLSNNYEMWHVNSSNILVGLTENNGMSLKIYENNILIGIPPNIIEFCYNDKYVCAKVIEKKYTVDKENEIILFYILDTEDKYVYEALTESEYIEKVNYLQIQGLTIWKSTKDIK
jgi:hypothetical protein